MEWHGRLHVLPIECKGDFPGTHLAHKWDSDAAYALPLLHTLFFEPLFHWLQTVFIPFAASFIYMNGDKPRSEYYHLRSICCYTTIPYGVMQETLFLTSSSFDLCYHRATNPSRTFPWQ